MTPERFEKLLEEITERNRKTLLAKNEEYSSDGERLHNFYSAARMDGCTPETALGGC